MVLFRMLRRALALALVAASAGPSARAQPDTLSVLTINLWHDQGDWPTRLDLIVAQAAALRPDVVLMQEVLQDAGLENQAQTLARRLGLAHVTFVSTDSAHRARRYGNAIASRFPIRRTSERRLAPLDQYRTAAMAEVEVRDRTVRFYTTHLHHVPTAPGSAVRAMQIVDLLDFVEVTAESGAPVVLGGDFNARPTWPEMRMLSVLRDVPAAFGAMGGTYGLAYERHPFPGQRIDYLFDARDPRLVPVSAAVVLDHPDASGHWPSDHFGVYARFVLR